MPKTDLSELKIDVVFVHPDGSTRVSKVSDLRQKLRVALILPVKGFVVAEYAWSGESDAEGRPIYK